jgi:hypothetical protein
MKLRLGSMLWLALGASVASAQVSPADLDRAWVGALAVIAGGDDRQTERELATPDPECFGLVETGPARLARLRGLARAWAGRPVTWTIGGDRARGLLGPPMPAMTTVCMRHERGAWRFSGFIPGD